MRNLHGGSRGVARNSCARSVHCLGTAIPVLRILRDLWTRLSVVRVNMTSKDDREAAEQVENPPKRRKGSLQYFSLPDKPCALILSDFDDLDAIPLASSDRNALPLRVRTSEKVIHFQYISFSSPGLCMPGASISDKDFRSECHSQLQHAMANETSTSHVRIRFCHCRKETSNECSRCRLSNIRQLANANKLKMSTFLLPVSG